LKKKYKKNFVIQKIDLYDKTANKNYQQYIMDDEIYRTIASLRKSFNLGEIDIFTLIKDKIKNYKKLTDAELTFIETLSEQQKMEIILLYNKMTALLEKYIIN
jgi:ribosome biogenesis GTPase A